MDDVPGWTGRRAIAPAAGSHPRCPQCISRILNDGDSYACADGRYVAIGAVEPKFFAELRQRCGIQDPLFDDAADPACWPLLKLKMADIFRTRTREQWCALLEGTEACFAPVLDWDEAPQHPHHVARQTYVTVDGVLQPGPAPRFLRTPSATPQAAQDLPVGAVLARWGVSA